MSVSIPTATGTTLGAGRGKNAPFAFAVSSGVFAFPTDPIGTATVTFDGVVAGSEIRVYDPDLNELAGVETCSTNHALTWPVYAAGSPNNNVQIKIINTAYKIKDFPYTSKVGAQAIPVQMEPDKWFNNPV